MASTPDLNDASSHNRLTCLEMQPQDFSLFKKTSQKSNRAGFSLIPVIAISAAVVTVAIVLMNYVPMFKKEALKTKDTVSVQMFLDSAIDYTLAGVKNRWCFSKSWTKDINCNIWNATSPATVNTNNSEVLLFSKVTRDFLIQANPGKPDPLMPTLPSAGCVGPCMTRTVSIGDITVPGEY